MLSLVVVNAVTVQLLLVEAVLVMDFIVTINYNTINNTG